MEKPPGTPVILIAVLSAVVIIIAALSLISFNAQKRSIQRDSATSLTAVADMKVKTIQSWRHEMVLAGKLIFRNPNVYTSIRDAFVTGNAAAREGMAGFLNMLLENMRYRRILFRDAADVLVFAIPAPRQAPGATHASNAGEALRTRQIRLSELYRDEVSGELLLDLTVPILGMESGKEVAAGVLVFQIDPREFLYPLIRSWPSLSRTAETLLIRREGGGIIFLNDLRHTGTPALSARKPVRGDYLPAGMAIGGREGVVTGMDYRGVPVMAAVRAIPESPWFLIAKIDIAEVYAPVRQRAGWIAALAAALIALAAATASLYLKDRRLLHYRRQYRIEYERAMYGLRYEAIIKQANDIIVLFEEDGTIVETSDNALKAYGYAPEELRGMDIRLLREPETRGGVDAMIRKVAESGSIRFESIHVRKDGTRFPVEVSASCFELQGKRHFLEIYRDVTERREAERALVESELKFRMLFDNSGDAIFIHDFDGHILEVNNVACERLGYDREELMRLTPMDFDAPDFADNFPKRTGELMEKKWIVFESAHMTRDGTRIPVEISSRVIDYRGKPAIISTARDITARKKAETALKTALAEKNVLLREVNHRVKNNLAIVSSLLNLQAGQISDPQARKALQESRERVRTIGLIHEKLYRTRDVTHIDIGEYLSGLAAQVIESYLGGAGRVRLETRIEPVSMNIDQAVPCGLIVNELVTNALKYGFPAGRSGTVRVDLERSGDGNLTLIVADDGAGFPENVDIRTAKSMGMQIVALLSEQLGGSGEFLPGKGVTFRLTFKAIG
jgi:PAS domain S-box-containing protein